MKDVASRTAMLAATGRAVHLLTYGGRALAVGWLAYPLLGTDADSYIDLARGLVGERGIDYAT